MTAIGCAENVGVENRIKIQNDDETMNFIINTQNQMLMKIH